MFIYLKVRSNGHLEKIENRSTKADLLHRFVQSSPKPSSSHRKPVPIDVKSRHKIYVQLAKHCPQIRDIRFH